MPQILIPALDQLEEAFIESADDPEFQKEFNSLLNNYAGRPTPISECRNLGQDFAARIFLKREDLLHGGAHKTNQVLGQALLTQKMGKTDVIAETGAGQHGVAVALAGADGFECSRLHGSTRYRTPIAQCVSHEANGGRSNPGDQRQQHLERCL